LLAEVIRATRNWIAFTPGIALVACDHGYGTGRDLYDVQAVSASSACTALFAVKAQVNSTRASCTADT
jgi:hypothetical protein